MFIYYCKLLKIVSMAKDSSKVQKKIKIKKDYLYLVPATIIIFAIIIFPLSYNLIISFCKTMAALELKYVGLENYQEVFTSPLFLADLQRTLIFSFVTAICAVMIGMVLAVIIFEFNFKYSYLILSLLFLPWLLDFVTTGLIWKWLLNPIFGGIGQTIYAFTKRSILGDTSLAFPAVTFVSVWKHIPFALVLFFAGLNLIPKEIHEAAKLDGATSWKRFRYITLPLLRATLVSVFLLLLIWQFGAFTIVWVMTEGGPFHSSELISIFIYNQIELRKFGVAAAASMSLFVISLLIIFIYTKFEMRRMMI